MTAVPGRPDDEALLRPDDEALLGPDDEALVRPFFLTGGRTRGRVALDAVVVRRAEPTPRPRSGAARRLEAEHRRILEACREPLAVAEVAATLRLPLGVIRVLVDDLLACHLVDVVLDRALVDEALLDRLIGGVRRL